LDVIRDFQNGIEPAGIDPKTYRNVRSADVVLPKDARWQEMAEQNSAVW
jgi:hypothetical protein